jgi:hypothetical protein
MVTKAGNKQARVKPGRTAKRQRYTVFISHSSLDKWIAERVAEKVAEAGAESWLDIRDLPGGGNIQVEINKGVRESNEVVVLFSPNSASSHWVSFEIGAASALGRHFTPVMNNVSNQSVQVIQGIKTIDLNDFTQYLTELKARIKKWREKRR